MITLLQAEVETPLVPLGAEIVLGLIALALVVVLVGTLGVIAWAVRETRRSRPTTTEPSGDAGRHPVG